MRTSTRRGDLTTMTLIEAVHAAIQSAMRSDPDVFVIGEDIGKRGGVFLATQASSMSSGKAG